MLPTQFLDVFPSPRRLGSYENLSFFPEEAVNDDLLRCLAWNGIWRNDLITEYRFNYITEDGIIDYCFGDYPPNTRKRELTVYSPSYSERLLEKLVEVCKFQTVSTIESVKFQACRSCTHACHVRLSLFGVPNLDTRALESVGRYGRGLWTYRLPGVAGFVLKYNTCAHWVKLQC